MFKEAIGLTGAELYGDIIKSILWQRTRTDQKAQNTQFAITLPR
jgi:hypothetical protein